MHTHGISAENGSGKSDGGSSTPVPLEELSGLTMKQIGMLHDRGILYVQELLAMLSNEETEGLLVAYLGLSRRETSELKEECKSLLTPEELRSLTRPVPRYPLGAEDYRRSEIENGKTGPSEEEDDPDLQTR